MNGNIDFTQGKPSNAILRFFFPMLATGMLQQFYSFADTAIVGRGLGDNALAAVGNMGSLCFLIIGFSMGLANGFSVLIAQRYGEKDFPELRRTLSAMIRLAVIITSALTVLSIVFLHPVLTLMQTDESIIGDSLTYGYILFGGLSATIFYNMSAGILRSLGDSKTPLKAIVISSVLNIAMDSLFIFVLRTGVWGAAAATIISQIISGVVCLQKLRGIDFLRKQDSDTKPDGALYAKLMKNGVPMALMNSITAVGCMVVQYFVNGLGVAYTSAYSACSKYINMFMQPACTAGFSMSAYTGQNYGAKRFDRISEGLKVCLLIAGISYVVLGTAIAVAVISVIGMFVINGKKPVSGGWYVVKFVGTVSITLTGVVFCFVLAPTMGDAAWNVQNILTHVVVPLAAVIDFFVTGVSGDIRKRSVIWVTIPPLLYAAYAGIGYICGWEFAEGITYPYFFLNWGSPAGAFGFTDELPFMGCAWWIIVILVLLIVVGILYLVITDTLKKLLHKTA